MHGHVCTHEFEGVSLMSSSLRATHATMVTADAELLMQMLLLLVIVGLLLVIVGQL